MRNMPEASSTSRHEPACGLFIPSRALIKDQVGSCKVYALNNCLFFYFSCVEYYLILRGEKGR